MNRELTKEEKDNLLRLNSKRLNAIKRMPWADQQDAYDNFVTQLNQCLTATDRPFVDLAMVAHSYVDLTDRQIQINI